MDVLKINDDDDELTVCFWSTVNLLRYKCMIIINYCLLGRPKPRKKTKRTEKGRKGLKRTKKGPKRTVKGPKRGPKRTEKHVVVHDLSKRRRKVGDRQQGSRQGSTWGK